METGPSGEGPPRREATLNRWRYVAIREVPDFASAPAYWQQDQWTPTPGLARNTKIIRETGPVWRAAACDRGMARQIRKGPRNLRVGRESAIQLGHFQQPACAPDAPCRKVDSGNHALCRRNPLSLDAFPPSSASFARFRPITSTGGPSSASSASASVAPVN